MSTGNRAEQDWVTVTGTLWLVCFTVSFLFSLPGKNKMKMVLFQWKHR